MADTEVIADMVEAAEGAMTAATAAVALSETLLEAITARIRMVGGE